MALGLYRGHDGMRQYVHDMNDAWEIVRLRKVTGFRPFRDPEAALAALGLGPA
jgi:hypothetical protein